MNAIVIRALVRRDLLIAASYRFSLLLSFAYGILGLALYFFISRTFGDLSRTDLGEAPSYFAFAAIGIVVGGLLDATTGSVGGRLREEQATGTLETLGTTPVSSLELSVGLVGFPFVFAALQAAVYLGVAVAWMELDVARTSWLGVATMLFLSGMALTPIGILAGAAVLVLKRGQLISGTLVYLMSLLSGMLFPVSVLPNWVSPLAYIFPLRDAFEGTRSALFAGTGWVDDALSLGVWAVLLWPLSVFVFDWAGRRARRAGSLSEY